MEASGAGALHLRLEQQRHWQQSTAVREGLQPSIDPDSHALRELRGGERLYACEAGAYVKCLIDGAWARIEVG